jgi:GTP pyrophosphokinase
VSLGRSGCQPRGKRDRLVMRAAMEHGSTKVEVEERSRGPVLADADYSFYQRMKNEDITEDFLWSARLEPMLEYIPHNDLQLIRDALALAFDAHRSQNRKSGEPFITHPVEVTRILAELHMDTDSLVAGLLHDTVEDCGESVGLDEIGFHFGQDVQKIVEGETKFSKLPTHHPERVNSYDQQSANDEKAQDLQFLFLAMTEEVRIIVVKLADRLHNMRTMASMPQNKQRRIALETLQVFSPLARLLGLYTIKEELEELSFNYAMPQQYAITKRAVNRLWETQRVAVEAAARELEAKIDNDPYLAGLLQGVKIEISRKALYSIWKKLQDSGRSIRDVSEIAQLRVILHPSRSVSDSDAMGVAASERQLCYHTMGLIHSFWAPIPGSMKDYIATPKPNNYQSLHTAVIPTGLVIPSNAQYTSHQPGNGNGTAPKPKNSSYLFPIEIQIKTEEMQRLAQFGIAIDSWFCSGDFSDAVAEEQAESNGHIPSGSRMDSLSLTRRINWLNSIRQWQEEFVDTLSAQEFVDCVTDDLLGQGVFVFTPSGQVMRLPKGASVVDFAYHIHTDIGNMMVAARVNGKIVPAEHRLANAEVVEVITYKGPTNANIVRRHQQWIDAAQTKSARHKILKFLKDNSNFLIKTQSFVLTDDGPEVDTREPTSAYSYWLKVHCIDRPGLLADISNVISQYNQNILSYNGYRETDSNAKHKFTMVFELEGPTHLFPMLIEATGKVQSVTNWNAYCNIATND